jgi:uncharacterized membrane protein
MRNYVTPYLVGLGAATVVSLGLLALEAVINHEMLHGYLVWNLFLAWVPLLLAFGLRQMLTYHRWSNWKTLFLSVIWFAFFPNSFYIISDFIHISELTPDQLLLGVIVTSAFVFAGVSLGVSSLYIIHTELNKRLQSRLAVMLVAGMLLVASGAIYVGRDLRWNSWDLLLNPFGLLFDMSERLMHPSQYPQVLAVIIPFFALIAMIYFVVWQAMWTIRPPIVMTPRTPD